jgi:hypothetical protein
MIKNSLFLSALILALYGNGCVNTQIVNPEYLLMDTTKDIIVATNAAQSIRMYSGNYKIARNDSVISIQGKGTIISQDGQSIDKPFKGTIPFPQIDLIETHEKTVFYYSGYYIFGAAAAAFAILVIITFGGRGVG